jgi:hypothetical protein
MTNHTWAQGAANCAVARSHQHPFGSERQVAEFETFRDLIVMAWRFEHHPIYPAPAAG